MEGGRCGVGGGRQEGKGERHEAKVERCLEASLQSLAGKGTLLGNMLHAGSLCNSTCPFPFL